MKKSHLAIALALVCVVCFAASPTFQSFNTTQFGTTASSVSVKDGFIVTNVTAKGTTTVTGDETVAGTFTAAAALFAQFTATNLIVVNRVTNMSTIGGTHTLSTNLSTGVGFTNIAGIDQINLTPGSNITFTTNANGNLTITASGGGGGSGTTSISSADFVKTGDTTFATVTDLSQAVLANTTYLIACDGLVNEAGTTANVKFQFLGPTAPTTVNVYGNVAQSSTAAVYSSSTAFSTSMAFTSLSAGNRQFRWLGVLVNGANAGTFAVQMAQNTSDAGATTILKGARLTLTVVP